MKDYTYLLRFSDSVITDCQGQNLCGAISATVITNKGKKGEKCKKKTKTNKKTVIDHVAAILTNIKFYCKKKNDSQAEILIFLSQANGNSCQPNPSKQKLSRSRRRLLPSV